MKRRAFLRSMRVVGATAAFMCASPSAQAADRSTERAARQVLDIAASDFARMNYDTGASRLQKAIKQCGKARCTASTRAALLRDLGAMQFRMDDADAARKSWAAALAAQPDLELNPSYDAADVRAAFARAKGGDPEAASEPPPGDFEHTPASAQRVNLPLPVYVEYHGATPLVRVVVKYQAQGASDWARMNLKRMGAGWGGLIPCSATAKGVVRYWVQGFDDGGDPVASSGDPRHPFAVPMRTEIEGDAPHLPGRAPPEGCEEEQVAEPAVSKGEEPSPEPSEATGGAQTYARFWVGVSGSLDFLSLPAQNAVCQLSPSTAQPINAANYYCTNPNGMDFPLRSDRGQQNGTLVTGQAGQVAGGLQPGDVRVMLSFDYAWTSSLLVGARLGYVLNAYPGTAAVKNGRAFGSDVEFELRATYLFGENPLTRVGFAPMVFGGLGIGEFDGHTATAVSLNNVAGQETVNAWITNGPFFVNVGGGTRYAFSSRLGLTLAARLNTVFGGNGFLATYGPEVGIAYGF